MIALNIKNLAALALAGFVLAGCSSTPTQENAGDTETVAVSDQSGGDASASTYGAGENGGLTSEELAAQQAAAEQEARDREAAALREVRTFYFDFDKSVLKPEAHLPLKAHAAFLAANGAQKVVLSGYTDERGTKEY
ncbi:MAG: peptidoglycan-associated lipoprotein, partial [Gammaproteobacteria bacterium]